MFKAIARWFKSVGYWLTGRVDDSTRGIDLNPHVVRARYEEIIREKTSRIHTYKQAVAGLISQQTAKMAKIKTLTDDVERLENLKAGALAKAKQMVAKLQGEGQSMEAIKSNEEYLKCLSAYNDFTSTLAEKQERIAELEGDVGLYQDRIKEHKIQLQSLLREIDKLKSEKSDAVADVITAKEEKEIADTLAGIAEDGTSEELQRMRQLREEIKAEARVSKELAGTNTMTQEAEFLEYARQSAANTEFDQLIGLAEAAETPAQEKTPEPPEQTTLPE